MDRRVSLLVFALKLFVTAGLLAWLLARLDLAPVLAQLRSIDPLAALSAVVLFVLQQALLAWRWQLVAEVGRSRIGGGAAFRLTLIGHFFNQVVPSGFAGDAARAWLATTEGAPFGPTVRAILCDRVIGLIALVLVIAATLLALPQAAARDLPDADALRAASLAIVLGFALFLAVGDQLAVRIERGRSTRRLATLLRDLRGACLAGWASVWILALAVMVQVLNVAAVVACARGMGVPLGFAAAWVVVPPVMFVALAPVSFAGWGVREGAMVFALGVLGVGPPAALAVSVAYGALLAIVGVPGALLWLGRRADAAAVATAPTERP